MHFFSKRKNVVGQVLQLLEPAPSQVKHVESHCLQTLVEGSGYFWELLHVASHFPVSESAHFGSTQELTHTPPLRKNPVLHEEQLLGSFGVTQSLHVLEHFKQVDATAV